LDEAMGLLRARQDAAVDRSAEPWAGKENDGLPSERNKCNVNGLGSCRRKSGIHQP
jgi:hypothetical protein